MINVTKLENGCNCYVLHNETAGVLIDTGLDSKADEIIKLCKEKRVKMMILTHGHVDHVQCAAKVAKELDIPILMHKNDMELISENLKQPMHGRTLKGKIVAFFSVLSAKSSSINDFKVSEIVTCNKEIHISEMDLEIVQLPGHTKGSIGVKAENHFFVGDALMNMGKPEVSLLYEDIDDLYESAKKISASGDMTIYFGHGNAVKNRNWMND